MARPRYTFIVLALFVLVFIHPLSRAQVQDPPRNVSLQLNNVDIRVAIKDLFESQGVNYALTQGVQGPVTVSLKNVSFRTAFEALLKTAKTPLTYRVENGIYHVGAKLEPIDPPQAPRVVKIRLNYISADAAVKGLKTLPRYAFTNDVAFQALQRDNSLLVTYLDDDHVRELKEALRLLDIPSPHVEVRAELVVVLHDSAGRKHRGVFDARGQIETGTTLDLKTALGNGGLSFSTHTLQTGRFNVRVTPQVHGDNTISLNADCVIDVLLKADTASKPLHLTKGFNGSIRVNSGDTMLLNGTVIKLDGKTGATEAELLLFLTPVLINPGGETRHEQVQTLILSGFTNLPGETRNNASKTLLQSLREELSKTGRYEVLPDPMVEEAARHARCLSDESPARFPRRPPQN